MVLTNSLVIVLNTVFNTIVESANTITGPQYLGSGGPPPLISRATVRVRVRVPPDKIPPPPPRVRAVRLSTPDPRPGQGTGLCAPAAKKRVCTPVTPYEQCTPATTYEKVPLLHVDKKPC